MLDDRTLAGAPTAQAPAAPPRRKRLLLLGGCQLDCLADELRADFDCLQLWRRPTIPLMSPPLGQAAQLGFVNRQSRYIERDLAKAHLDELRAATCDALIFEVVRDVRIPLVGRAGSYIFDPNAMHRRVPDALPPEERRIDVSALVGVEVAALDAADPRFLALWTEHFARFHEAVLAPLLANGRTVILQRVFLAAQTMPPTQRLARLGRYRAERNALLHAMYAVIERYPGIITVGIEEAQCLSTEDAKSGLGLPHLAPEVFALMADQVRAILAPDDERIGPSLFDRLMKRTAAYHDLKASSEAELHALRQANLALQREAATLAWRIRHTEKRRLGNRLRRAAAALARRLRRGPEAEQTGP